MSFEKVAKFFWTLSKGTQYQRIASDRTRFHLNNSCEREIARLFDLFESEWTEFKKIESWKSSRCEQD